MITLKVLNNAGLHTIAASEPFLFDKSPPENGVVYDGLAVSTFYLNQINNRRNIFEG